MPEAQMKHLFGPLWWANRTRFLRPGVYWRARRLLALPTIKPLPPHAIEFPEQTLVIAKDQPEYQPLPVYASQEPDMLKFGQITCCWKLSLRDRFKLLFRGVIWHRIWTFNQPLQPQALLVDKPHMPPAQ